MYTSWKVGFLGQTSLNFWSSCSCDNFLMWLLSEMTWNLYHVSHFNPYSCVELRPWTFQWNLTLHLLIWTVSHINISLHQWCLTLGLWLMMGQSTFLSSAVWLWLSMIFLGKLLHQIRIMSQLLSKKIQLLCPQLPLYTVFFKIWFRKCSLIRALPYWHVRLKLLSARAGSGQT